MSEGFANDFETRLIVALDAVSTSINVLSAAGAPGAPFRCRIDDELVMVTSVGAGTNWTITRAIENTTAAAHMVNASVTHVLTTAGLAAAIAGSAVSGVLFSANNLSDVADVAAARLNLWLGTAAVFAATAFAAAAHTHAWADITGAPTTISGYGITDAYTKTQSDARFAPIAVPWNTVTGTPTTLAGYDITDAYTKTAADGRYLQSANNLSDVGSVGTARTNLGLGTAAVQNVSAFLQPSNNLSDVGAAATAATNLGLGAASAVTHASLTLTAGTVAASTPFFSATQTWNNAGATFTGALINVTDTASNVASLLLDLQVASTSKFNVAKDGSVTVTGQFFGVDGTPANPTYAFAGKANSGLYRSGNDVRISANGTNTIQINSNSLIAGVAGISFRATSTIGTISTGTIGFGSNTSVATALDTGLSRIAAGVMGLGNGTAANVTGQLNLTTCALQGVAFASLPGTPAAGMCAYVTDSNIATWGSTIAGGGANKVLAFYDGTNWTVAGK